MSNRNYFGVVFIAFLFDVSIDTADKVLDELKDKGNNMEEMLDKIAFNDTFVNLLISHCKQMAKTIKPTIITSVYSGRQWDVPEGVIVPYDKSVITLNEKDVIIKDNTELVEEINEKIHKLYEF